MIKNDRWIREMGMNGMISPFTPDIIRYHNAYHDPYDTAPMRHVLSYGVGSYGYDLRLSPKEFKIFRHIPGKVIDPKNFSPENLVSADLIEDESGSFFILPAHSYGLGVALEHLRIPDDVTVICLGKSSYARVGIIANITPGEAGWVGHLTLEFSNSSSADCRIYANEGIVQILFLQGEPCGTTYADRNGKYQNQPELVVPSKV